MTERAERLGSAREEAERLVAAGLGWASTALHGVEANRQLRALAEQVFTSDRVHDLAAGLAGFVSGSGTGSGTGSAADFGSTADFGSSTAGLSTGSADCCVCPVCRLIAALRDPTPEFAERLASTAGDLAVGISGLLRALSAAVPRPGHRADDPWHAATTTPPPARTAGSSPGPGDSASDTLSPPSRRPRDAEAPAPKRVAKKAVAKKAVAKKNATKKAVRKAVRKDPGDSAR
ncbi:MAG TPA: hypothetical protein VGP31_14390 [Planosporangium sp.]|nr:hypothetical protein [Planosporangium sp.]